MGLAILLMLTMILLTLWVGLAIIILKLNEIEKLIRKACECKGIPV